MALWSSAGGFLLACVAGRHGDDEKEYSGCSANSVCDHTLPLCCLWESTSGIDRAVVSNVAGGRGRKTARDCRWSVIAWRA